MERRRETFSWTYLIKSYRFTKMTNITYLLISSHVSKFDMSCIFSKPLVNTAIQLVQRKLFRSCKSMLKDCLKQ